MKRTCLPIPAVQVATTKILSIYYSPYCHTIIIQIKRLNEGFIFRIQLNSPLYCKHSMNMHETSLDSSPLNSGLFQWPGIEASMKHACFNFMHETCTIRYWFMHVSDHAPNHEAFPNYAKKFAYYAILLCQEGPPIILRLLVCYLLFFDCHLLIFRKMNH